MSNLFAVPPTCLSKERVTGTKKNPKDVVEVDNSGLVMEEGFPHDAKIKTITGCTGSLARFVGLQLGYAPLSNYDAEPIMMPALGEIGGKQGPDNMFG